jgi:hypothetical protein
MNPNKGEGGKINSNIVAANSFLILEGGSPCAIYFIDILKTDMKPFVQLQ